MFKKRKLEEEKDIYTKYADYMYTVCCRYIGSPEIAEEILNDGFIKVFKNLHNYQEKYEDGLKFWIKKIMINECLMFLRKKKHFKTIQIETITANEDFMCEQIGEIDEIFKLILQLPIGYRTVFNLFAIEGYSHTEIAEKLDITESTSRSQLTMARKVLKSKLPKYGFTIKQ